MHSKKNLSTPVESPETRILIVEDETIVALDMRARLQSLGYTVVGTAPSSELAIALAKKYEPHLVLMDIKLHGDTDGVETARRICKIREVPVVFVTAYTDESTLRNVQSSSSYGYIVKPYHERELRIAIELALSKFSYERKILEAKEKAEEHDRAKSLFLSNISHELKTPLNAIIGFTDLAATLAEDPELKEYIYMASRGARKLESSINSLLDYTKLESGALVPVYSEFALEDMLARSWEPYAAEAYGKGLALSLCLDPALPQTLHGDAVHISAIIKNLLENAVKFTESGYVSLSARREIVDGKSMMQISVADSGRGIPADFRETIFKRFTQFDESYTRLVGGMGLGLSLVQGLAHLLDIQLTLRENPAGGTEFQLRMAIDAKAARSYPESAQRFYSFTIGLFGMHPEVAKGIGFMAESLGAGILALDSLTIKSGSVNALFIDVASWSRCGAEVRERCVAAVKNGLPLLFIVGSPGELKQNPEPGTPQRVSYPLGLNIMYSALQRAASAVASGKAVADPSPLKYLDVRIETPGILSHDSNKNKHETASLEYAKLFDAAKTELRASADMNSAMQNLFLDIQDAYINGDEEAIERIAKRHYDNFSEQKASACAKFTLSVLMDSRKGPGPWIRSLHALMKNNLGS